MPLKPLRASHCTCCAKVTTLLLVTHAGGAGAAEMGLQQRAQIHSSSRGGSFEDLLSRDFEPLSFHRFKMERGKGEKRKGKEKVINPDGNMTFKCCRHYWKASLLKSTGKANASRPVCMAGKSPLRCTCSPSAYKSLQLPAFHSSSFYLGLCPR